MSRTAYVNGAYRPLSSAGVSVLDRGFQFGDAVYEVWAVREGRLLDTAGHLTRLKRSLGALRIAAPMSEAALMAVVRETMRRNRVRDGIVYLQISRGAAPRDHAFPVTPVRPTLIVTAKNLSRALLAKRAEEGGTVITVPEIRWARCDIKSTNLLPNVLAKQQAREAGALEAWFVDRDGFVTEGASSTAWIIDAQGRVRTRELSNRILPGVTRAALLAIAAARALPVIEEPFSVAEAQAAREAFASSASGPVVPITAIDGVRIGDGRPGPISRALHAFYLGAE